MNRDNRLLRWFGDSLHGAGAYLQSVFLAVLLAPVLPDLAVDLFGESAPPPVLRALAVLLVVAACIAIYRWNLRQARRHAARADAGMHNVGHCDVLILGLNPRSRYSPPDKRMNDREIPEYLIDQTKPTTVVLLTTTAVTHDKLAEIHTALQDHGITVHIVHLSNPYQPEIVVPEVSNLVLPLCEQHNLVTKKIFVDITAGTVPMTLAMLRLAVLLNAQTVYVWSKYQGTDRKPFSQQSVAFHPQHILPPHLP